MSILHKKHGLSFIRKLLMSSWVIIMILMMHDNLIAQGPSFLAYSSTATTGNQSFTGRLGLGFTPTACISIDSLGAFDSGANGFDINTTITVAIIDSLTGLTVAGPLTFTNASPGTLNGHFRMKPLAAPAIIAGNRKYFIVAVGFNSNDQNYNTNGTNVNPATTNTGSGLINFGTNRYDNNTTIGFPGTLDGGPIGRYHAGTFRFKEQLPTLTAIVNDITINTTTDGVNDVASLSVCSGKPSPNLNLGPFSTTGGPLAKVHQEITFTNAAQSASWCVGGPSCVAPASAFNPASVINTLTTTTTSPGTVVLRFRAFVDLNNNNIVDADECPGDWAVFTVTVNPQPNAGGDQTACRFGRAIMAGVGTGTWTAQSGNPGTATIVAPTSPTTAITGFTNQGTYNFIFTAPGGCSDTASVTVSNTIIVCPADITVNIGLPGKCDTLLDLVTPTVTACAGHTVVGPYINGILMTGATTTTLTAGRMHFVSYSIYDPTGFRLDSCIRKYTINDFFHSSLACQQIQASLGGDCKDTITVREALVGWDQPDPLPDLLGCDTLYKINVKNSIGQDLGPVLTSAELNKVLTYTVTHPNGFTCSSTVEVKDKIKPKVICRTDSIKVSCLANIDTITKPQAMDNCPGARVILVDLRHFPLECDPNFVGKVLRTWIAEDAQGVKSDSVCTDSIYLIRSVFTGITSPDNDTLRCNESYQVDNKGFGYPHPNVTGIPRFGSKPVWPQSQLELLYCNAMIDYEDRLLLDSDCKKRIQRIWTITEWWCNTTVFHIIGVQMIDIVDNIKPSIPQLDSMTISTESKSCKGRLTLPALNITDECTSVITIVINAVQGITPSGFINGNGGTMTLDTGLHVVTYRAFDKCGNDSLMTFKVRVLDNTDPVAICDQLATISLKANGYTEITASAVDDGSFDECGPVSLKIRRMEDPCNFGADTAWYDKVGFCCQDGDRTRMVQLRVTDLFGNQNTCMVSVRIQNKVTPTISCPGPQTKQCDFTYDPDNLKDYFGPAIISGSECLGSAIPRDEITTNTRNQCGIGHIIRTISLPNNGGSCTQRIDFTAPTVPFDGPYSWPRDTTITGQCTTLGLDTAALGAPRFNDGLCSMVGMRYDDQTFPFSTNGACFKIIRTWKVIDWCQTVTVTAPVLSTGPRTWTWEQEIKVMDNQAPVLSVPLNQSFGSVSCTSADVELIATATDCTPQAELRWNYTVRKGNTVVKTGNSNAIDDEFEIGDYKVIWRVEDRCGNLSVDSSNFRIVTTKAASAICKNGLASPLTHMDTNGDNVPDRYLSMLSPSFFNNKSVHACDSLMPLRLSFSPNVNDTIRTYSCDSVGVKTVRMYVTDIYGNQTFCQTTVDIQATAAQCPGTGTLLVNVAGKASTEKNESIEDVSVEMKGSELPVIKTDKSGIFNFGVMPAGGKYEIIPSKDGDDLNGVSTLDAVIIQRHILGIETLKTPYQMIAADVNNSGSISASDLTELRKLLLGINNAFSNNSSWRFVDASYKFADINNPWQAPLNEKYNIDHLNANMEINFVGIKVGDVNGNAKPTNVASTLESRTKYNVLVDDIFVKKGDKLSIPISIEHDGNIYGAQSKFIENGIHINNVESGDLVWNFKDADHTNAGEFRFNMVAADGLNAKMGQKLMILHGEALMDGKLSTMLALDEGYKSEVYTDGLETKKLTLKWRDKGSQDFVFNGVVPNPWNTQTTISFALPTQGKVTLRMMDYTGRTVLTGSDTYPAGTNTITINKSDLSNAGVYLYELRYNDKVLSGKMIVIE